MVEFVRPSGKDVFGNKLQFALIAISFTLGLLLLLGPKHGWQVRLQSGTMFVRYDNVTAEAAEDAVPPQLDTKQFYLLTLEEVEAQEPWLAECGITNWAALTYQQLQYSPRRTMDPAKAALWVFPPYMTYNINWPMYGGGRFEGINVGRNGARCNTDNEQIHLSALAIRERLINSSGIAIGSAPRVLMFDTDPWWPGHDVNNDIVKKYFRDDRLAWAALRAEEGVHRPGIDVSVPPPILVDPEKFTPHEGFGVKDRGNLYLFTFKGAFNTHVPLRANAMGSLHNEAAGVIVVDIANPDSNRFDYIEIMAKSLYSAVPRGDAIWSFRFSEVVCSGSVPVIMADGWVPPLNGTVAADTYSIWVREGEVNTAMLDRLRAIPPEEHARLRHGALQYCHRHAASIFHTIRSTMDEALLYATPSSL